MRKPTKKEVIGGAMFAAGFIPAVRGARVAMGVGKMAAKAYRAKKAEAAYRASKPNYDAVTRREKIQDAYNMAQRAVKRKK